MILVCVIATVSKNNVRRNRLQFLAHGFHFFSMERHETVTKRLEERTFQGICSCEQRGSPPSFLSANFIPAEHNPMKHRIGVLRCETQNRSATANLDVVRVSSNTEDIQSRRGIL